MNIKQLFPSPWLSPDDLNDRRVEVVIAGFAMEEMHNRRTNQKESKPVISFERATKRLILNKTQAFAIARIAGSDETGEWLGKKISLRVGRAPNGKPTIAIDAPALQAPTPHMNGAVEPDADSSEATDAPSA